MSILLVLSSPPADTELAGKTNEDTRFPRVVLAENHAVLVALLELYVKPTPLDLNGEKAPK